MLGIAVSSPEERRGASLPSTPAQLPKGWRGADFKKLADAERAPPQTDAARRREDAQVLSECTGDGTAERGRVFFELERHKGARLIFAVRGAYLGQEVSTCQRT